MECPPIERINRRRINATYVVDQSALCTNNLLKKSVTDGIEVRGGVSQFLVTNDYTSIYVVIETESKNRTADIEISVKDDFKDFAGNALVSGKKRILYYRPFPPPKKRQKRLLWREIVFPERKGFSGKLAGQAATVAVAGAGAASLATSSANGGSGSGASIAMINNVQKLHMTGMLAVRRLPDGYQNFTGEIKWAVLDIKTPWEDNNSTKKKNVTTGTATGQRNKTGSNQRSLKVVEAAFELQDEESEFQYFQRMMFWIPALFLIIITIHILVIAYCVISEKPLPDMLQPPRLELMLAFFSLPPISIACAGLYHSSREKAMLATWVLVAIPGLFLTWNVYMLWFYIFRLPPHLREVNLIMDVPNKKQRALRNVRRLFVGDGQKVRAANHRNTSSLESMRSSAVDSNSTAEPVVVQMAVRHPPEIETAGPNTMHGEAVMEEPARNGEDSTNEQEAASCAEIFESISNMTLLTLLFGEHQNEAEWVVTRTQGSKFGARYGFLFEEHRGPAIGRRNVSLQVDPSTGQVDRGELVILRERPLVAIPFIRWENKHLHIRAKRVYRYHLQMMTKLLDISKTILVGCIVAGVGNTDDNASSIVALIALSLLLIFLLRIAKPFPSRLDMLMLLLAEVADLIVYTCALFLVLGPNTDEDTDEKIGMALVLSEAFALLAMIMEYSIISLGLGIGAWEGWTNRHEDKFFKAVHELLMKNERYLRKKYADRWMVRTLSRGLRGRIPDRHELPWKKAVKMYVIHAWNGVRWLLEESKNVWRDGVEKLARQKRREILQGQTLTMRHLDDDSD